jgi:hypothetical protein
VLNSETESSWYLPVRQPDSDSYRVWEIAGTAHMSTGTAQEREARQQRDFGSAGSAPVGLSLPSETNPNTLSFAPVAAAAVHHL